MDIPGYKIIEPMGRNTSGPVYLATQNSSGKTVVIKFLYKKLLPAASLELSLKRFLEQGAIACKISHPNVARVHEVGHTEHFLYTIADYIEGKSIETLGQGICILDQIYIVKQIAKALDYLANNQCGHYNIKPANIILAADSSRAVLVDFGFGGAGQLDYSLLAQEKLQQTAYYASPEQMQNAALDIRSDLYNLGAIFYTLLSEKPLFAASSLVVGGKSSGMSDIKLPENKRIFQSFIDRALAKSPDKRFQSGQEMIAALQAIDDEEIIHIKNQQGLTAPESKQEQEQEQDIPLPESTSVKFENNVVPLFKEPQPPASADFLRQPGDADFYAPADQVKSIPDYSPGTSFLSTDSEQKDQSKKAEEERSAESQGSGGDSKADTDPESSKQASSNAADKDDCAVEQFDEADDVYQALMERPWPLYQPKPTIQKSSKRRTLLLFAFFLAAALFYLLQQDDTSLVGQYEQIVQWIDRVLSAF